MAATHKKRLPKSHREAISRGQIARYERIRDQNLPDPDKKRCTQCGEVKGIEDFNQGTRKLKSGETKRYPAGECKPCNAKRAAEWRQKKRESGELPAMQKKWNSSRDPEHRKAYQREYEYMRRRKAGMAFRGPWKRYRNLPSPQMRLDSAPLVEWIKANYGDKGMTELARLAGVDETKIYQLVRGWYYAKDGSRRASRKVSIDLADRILTASGNNVALVHLYPDLYD